MVPVTVVSGTLDFNPLTDKLKAADGSEFALTTPYGDELPQRGFDAGEDTYQAPPVDGSKVAFGETCAYYFVPFCTFRFSYKFYPTDTATYSPARQDL